MAEVKPFKGILYNSTRINNLAEVVAPPYDVISSSYQQDLYTRHPYNVIRLILGKPEPDDCEQQAVHERSAGFFQQWLADGVEPGFSDLSLGITLPVTVGRFKISALATYTVVLLDAVGKDNHFWYGITVDYK